MDFAFECTSVNRVLDTMFGACRLIARVVIVSIWSRPVVIDVCSVVVEGLGVRCVIVCCGGCVGVVRLVGGGGVGFGFFVVWCVGLGGLVFGGFGCLVCGGGFVVGVVVGFGFWFWGLGGGWVVWGFLGGLCV
ncbi:hypothetical protein ACTHUT_22050, partial [Neisseria sp. P0022.S010]